MQSTTLRPGLLVSLKSSIRGNVAYIKNTIEAEHRTDDGAERAKWETTRRIENPEEHERARKTQSKANSLIRGVCSHSAFGLLCPESKSDELAAAIAQAQALAAEFNDSATLSRVSIYVITGRVAPDDVEAIKAINSEIRDLMADMADGVKALDVKSIRDAANRAREMGAMLTPNAEARVRIAIDTAREAARKIVKAGETAAKEIDTGAIRKITEMRTTFLELDDAPEAKTPEAVGRAVDLMVEATNGL